MVNKKSTLIKPKNNQCIIGCITLAIITVVSSIGFYFLGRAQGYNGGTADGKSSGYDVGYSIGHDAGYQEGYSKGEEHGRDTGYKQGYSDMYDKAMCIITTGGSCD